MKLPRFLDFLRTLGVKLTRAQRVACAVCFDGVQPGTFTGADREAARSLFGDIDTIPPDLRTVVLWLKGARIGGTWLASLRALHLALTADLSSLAPGEAAFVLLVGPDTRLPKQALRYIAGALQNRALAGLLVSESTESLTIRRGDGREVTFEVLPATKGGSAVRGRSLVAAVMTEAAFFRGADFAINADEVYRAILPRVLDGGQLILETTPWSEAGLVWELFRDNHGTPTTCVVAHCPTLLMRDDIRTKAIVLREKLRDPDNARREFDAEFMGAGAGLFFDPSLLAAMVDPSLSERVSAEPGVGVAVGGDLALYHDASAVVVVHRTGDLFVVAETYERSPRKGSPLDLATVIGEFAAIATRHGAREIMADHHLLPVANSLMPDDLRLVPCPPGQLGKTETHLAVRDLIRAGLVRIPPSASRLRDQLAQITSTPGTGGGLQIRSPRRSGTHGDLASAFVLAVYAASAGAYQPFDLGELNMINSMLRSSFAAPGYGL